MRLEGRTGETITTLDEWEQFGGPASAGHWVRGRSAFELAADWLDGEAPQRVQALLSLRPEFTGLQLELGVAERKTRFDANPRGPRNHDLLVEAKANQGPVIIGVEGKADEPFDLPLGEWRRQALARNPASGAPARLDGLTSHFFGTTLEEEAGEPPLAGLGYQLLSALAGTLADAKRTNAVRAVLLVHEFVTERTTDEKHARNRAAIEDFIARLAGRADVPRVGGPDGWISDPVTVRGDGQWMPTELPVHVAKLVTHTRGATRAPS